MEENKMAEDKLDKIMRFVEEAKEEKGWDRLLGWLERHPILSVIIIYIFVAKITNAVKENKYKKE
jgi:hypothetical protein